MSTSCCSLPSKDNQFDVILLQVKREIKELQDTTTARFLMQDGKIAETCVYIKNNLSNAIRELLDALQMSGELDNIITSTVLGSIEILQHQVEYKALLGEAGVINLQHPYGHVKRYGATGDGATDDTACINICIENCKKFGVPLSADAGTYKISADVNMRYIKRVDFAGDIVTDNGSYLIIGNSSADGSGCNLKFGKVKNVRVLGLKNSIVDVLYCDMLNIRADGDDSTASSTAYTQFSGAYCKEIVFESSGTNIGWINENVFRIKRIEKITIDGNYPHNNNHFEHCNLERGVLNFRNARNNYISARSEGGLKIISDNESQANFIEKEYYYRHYFAEDLKEDGKGTLSFYPVNKLQTERELYRLDAFNRFFPVGSVYFNSNGTFNGVTYNQIFRSNLIKIDNTFALKMIANVTGLRVQLNFYDANKNRITAEVDNFADGKMSYISPGGEWSYVISTNVNNDSVVFYPGTAKYVEYRVIFGDGAETKSFDYIKIKLLKYINTDVNVTNTIENNVYTSVPDSGYWERGQKLYAKNPTPGTYIGIICTESGTPGVWRNFAQIQG